MINVNITSKITQFIIGKIGIKFDPYKLKKINDIGFIIIEKLVIKLNKLIPLYLDFYNNMIDNEIALADISVNNNVLHIGCGPIPATSILITKKTDAHVSCIDKNPKSVQQAQILLKKLGIANNIQVFHAGALNYPLKEYDLIIISQGVKPYYEILNYISKFIENDTKVIFRTSSSIDSDIVDKDLFLKKIFVIKKIIPQKKNGLLISILLLKK